MHFSKTGYDERPFRNVDLIDWLIELITDILLIVLLITDTKCQKIMSQHLQENLSDCRQSQLCQISRKHGASPVACKRGKSYYFNNIQLEFTIAIPQIHTIPALFTKTGSNTSRNENTQRVLITDPCDIRSFSGSEVIYIATLSITIHL